LKSQGLLLARDPYFSNCCWAREKTSAPTGALICFAFLAIEVRIKRNGLEFERDRLRPTRSREHLGAVTFALARFAGTGIGRRSRLQLECHREARGAEPLNVGERSKLDHKPIPSQAPLGVETRRTAPALERPMAEGSPDHERHLGGGESRSGTKICFSKGNASSSPRQTLPGAYPSGGRPRNIDATVLCRAPASSLMDAPSGRNRVYDLLACSSASAYPEGRAPPGPAVCDP
jgi:hypothetical protein